MCPNEPKKIKWLLRSTLNIFKKWSTYIVCTHLLPEGWVSNQIFKKGGLTGSKFLEGGCWKRRGDFFEEGEGGKNLTKNFVTFKR